MEDGFALPGSDEGITFNERGYRVIEADYHPGFNESVREQLGRLMEDPGPFLLPGIPKLQEVCEHPDVHAGLVELLGEDFQPAGAPSCHIHLPGTPRQGWYCALEPNEDGELDAPPRKTDSLLALYYPQDVPHELGPTLVVRGSHQDPQHHDFLATAVDLPDQVELVVKAGSVALVDGRVWHAAAENRGILTRYMVRFAFRR